MPSRDDVFLWSDALHSLEESTTMSNYDPTIHDLQRTVDELRKDRDDWKELAEKAIAQIEEWRALCDIYQDRYNQIVRGN
jgi:hypothetical protein